MPVPDIGSNGDMYIALLFSCNISHIIIKINVILPLAIRTYHSKRRGQFPRRGNCRSALGFTPV